MIADARTMAEGVFSPPKSHRALTDMTDVPMGPGCSAAAIMLCNRSEVDVVLCGMDRSSLSNY